MDIPFIFTHYLLLIFIIWRVLFVYISFVCCFYFAWVSSTFIETHSVFVFTLSLPPLAPPLSPTHRQAASQSKAQKKLQPLTQVPVLQEQGEYCAGVGGVRTWVPVVWSRGGGWVFFPILSSPCFSALSQLSSFRSPPGMVWVLAPLSSPFSLSQRDAPHAEPRMWGSLWCVCASVHGLQRSVQLCVCVLGCINT